MSIIDSDNLSFLIEQSKRGMAFRNTLCRNSYGHLKAVSFGGRFGVCSFNTYLSIAEGVWINDPTPEKVESLVSRIERQMELDIERLSPLGYHFYTYGAYRKYLDENGSHILIARPLSLMAGCGFNKSPLKLLMENKSISPFEEDSLLRRYSLSGIAESAITVEMGELDLEDITALTPEMRDFVVRDRATLYREGDRKFFDNVDHWDYDVMQYPTDELTGIGKPV